MTLRLQTAFTYVSPVWTAASPHSAVTSTRFPACFQGLTERGAGWVARARTRTAAGARAAGVEKV